MGRLYGINESTIHYIQKNEKASQESVAASTVPNNKVLTHVRDALTTLTLRRWMLLSPRMPRSSQRWSWEPLPTFPRSKRRRMQTVMRTKRC